MARPASSSLIWRMKSLHVVVALGVLDVPGVGLARLEGVVLDADEVVDDVVGQGVVAAHAASSWSLHRPGVEYHRSAARNPERRLQLEEVAQRDPLPGLTSRELRRGGPVPLHRPGVQGAQPQPPPLVEAERMQVVVGGEQPQAPATAPGGQLGRRLEQDAALDVLDPAVQRPRHLQLVAVHDPGEQAEALAASRSATRTRGGRAPR